MNRPPYRQDTDVAAGALPGALSPAPVRMLAPMLVLVIAATLVAWSGPTSAGQSIPISALSEGGGSGTSGHYQLTCTVGQASTVGSSQGSGYALTNGLMAMLSDIEPPAIIHQPVPAVTARTAVQIEADITDTKSGVDTAVLYFREGGSLTFRDRPMLKEEGNVYAATLPPSAVTERGLVYYIAARDHLGNLGTYPPGAPDSLINLGIYFSDLSSALEMAAGKYRMVSLPGVPTNGNPDSVLADDFGRYDKKKWRLGRWNASDGECGELCYDEYPTIDDFSPGRAFWLISSVTRTFSMTGFATDISRPFMLHLAKGWNQIATPFGFATDWLSATVEFNQKTYSIGESHPIGADTIYVEDNLIAYDGAYQPFQAQLLPWAGYWLYNSSTQAVDLKFDPRPGLQSPQSSGLALAGPSGTLDFAATLKVRSTQSPEQVALAGIGRKASDTWDPADLHAPPPVGDYLRVVFRRDDWKRHSGIYMSDVRRSGGDGACWNFEVDASSTQHPSLSLATSGTLPDGWQVYIYDLESGVRLERASLPYGFDVDKSRPFVLAAGTADFIASEESSAKISLKPSIVSIVPNPFKESVRITFFLPERQTLALEVFSVEGRLVGTVASGEADEGTQIVTWDGRSFDGKPAAPGIYFLRLETGQTRAIEKVLKIN